MRLTSILCLILALAMIFIPLLSMERKNEPAMAPTSETEASGSQNKDDIMKVKISSTGKVEEISMYDYVVGALCAEVSPAYNEEALKAQAVACHTFALYHREKQTKSPDSSLDGAYLTDDYKVYQGYLSYENVKDKWGDKYDVYIEKMKAAVSAVYDKVMYCGGSVIEPAYFALCSGKTESAENVWGGSVPYLQSVVSAGDALAPDLVTTQKFSEDEFKVCAAKLNNCTLDEKASNWIGELSATDAGTVTAVTIGDASYKGAEVQKAFNLKSNNFTIKYSDSSFTFTVTGNGHGVGMSQYGADYMARQGSKYDEILKHYYTGIEIESIS